MILIPTITELTLVGVADRGVPNKERVVLRPTDTVSLGEFALISAIMQNESGGGVVPIPDSFFWFGDHTISAPSWVYVYTGPGTFSESKIMSTGQPAYAFHWNRKTVVFHDEMIVPVLVRFGGIAFGGTGKTTAPMTDAEWDEVFKQISGKSLLDKPEPASAPPPRFKMPGLLPPKK